jgi:hypothetical protein
MTVCPQKKTVNEPLPGVDIIGYKLSPQLSVAPVFPNSAIFPVNRIAKIAIRDKSLKPPFFLVVNALSSN